MEKEEKVMEALNTLIRGLEGMFPKKIESSIKISIPEEHYFALVNKIRGIHPNTPQQVVSQGGRTVIHTPFGVAVELTCPAVEVHQKRHKLEECFKILNS